MADRYLMAGHKLLWHLDRVNGWLDGNKIVPIHIDVGLSKGCNIRCEYCYGAIQGNLYDKGALDYFPREPLLNYMKDAGKVGVRSMALVGEAEPLINPHVYDAIACGKKEGIDIALGTNGTLFDNGEKGILALKNLSWIRFNLSAASSDSYKKVHGSNSFSKVIDNIKFAIQTKKDLNLPITIGIQMVLTPSNAAQAVPLAALGKQLGVDYFVIKQCSDTRDSKLGFYNRLDKYKEFEALLQKAEEFTAEEYDVIVKWPHIKNNGKRNYDSCLGAPFLLYSSGDGKIYPCGMFFGIDEKKYLMGDLTKKSFKEIINSDRYWKVIDMVTKIDVHTSCYSNCRTNTINEFLWRLKHPPEHVNFI